MSWRSYMRIKRARSVLAGAVALAAALGVSATDGTRAAGEVRTLTFYNIHTKETTTIEFKRDGQWIAGALDKFNYAFRDWRKNEVIKMDPALLDLLWELHTELGSTKPINLICGHRSRATNDMLRASVGGQANESQHITGRAADVQFPDVPLKALRYSALIRERGGVGFYPTSAIEFVHVDTGNVRHWPRLPRYELALLFPQGQSRHTPADGRPLSQDDVRVAKLDHADLARQVTAFYDSRSGRRPPVAMAGLNGPVPPVATPLGTAPGIRQTAGLQVASYQPSPQLLEAPRLVDRPSRFTTPAAAEQARLTDLVQRASFTPQVTTETPRLLSAPKPVTRPRAQPDAIASLIPQLPPEPPRDAARAPEPQFVVAPDFDEDHPDELSYRPFPIAPLMTTTASADDPALATLIHPDFARTFDLLDQTGSMPPMRLRPTMQVAEALWTQQFTGHAVNFDAMREGPDATPAALTGRKVRTR